MNHPIKGNFTTYSGERRIHHMPGGRFYGKTKPERCYVTEDEAYRMGVGDPCDSRASVTPARRGR